MSEAVKRTKKWPLLALVMLLVLSSLGLRGIYKHYNPSAQPPAIPEAGGESGLPANPRDHVMNIMKELDLSASQWVELARLGPPTGNPEDRQKHAEKVAEVLNQEQLAKFSAEMQELHNRILNHMMSKMSPGDQEEFLRRLERNPDYSPGPPKAFLGGPERETASGE